MRAVRDRIGPDSTRNPRSTTAQRPGGRTAPRYTACRWLARRSWSPRASTPTPTRSKDGPKVLLVCGILSSLLYVAIDVLGGLRYEGYSFTSQAISELMATGAPSEAFVDPLFITYGVLVLAFGVGVRREGVGRSRALRIAGALLMAYAALGFAGPTLFEMRPRGAGSLESDAPHIILTGVLVLLTLLAIGFGAFAFGTRFRIYSVATLLTVVVSRRADRALRRSTRRRAAHAGLGNPRAHHRLLVPAVDGGVRRRAPAASWYARRDCLRRGPPPRTIDGFVAPGLRGGARRVRAQLRRTRRDRRRRRRVLARREGRRSVGRPPHARRRRAVERGHDGRRHVHHQGPRGDDAGGGERARLARLRRAGRALLARVRAERQGGDHRAPAPRARGGARPARRDADRSRSCATSTTSRACSRGRSRRGRRGRATATTR